MILFRALAGISAAFVTPQVWAAIPALVPPQNIMKAMGIATAGLQRYASPFRCSCGQAAVY
jgi:predicted MFS family arabinose efflux permease